jgi:hypothetical protein
MNHLTTHITTTLYHHVYFTTTLRYESYRTAAEIATWGPRLEPSWCLKRLFGGGFEIPWLIAQNPGAFPWLELTDEDATAWKDRESYVCPDTPSQLKGITIVGEGVSYNG